jgi:hypothetical protein
MMTATATATRTATFTITDARYVGAKVGADLRLLNILYGRPSLESIAEFAEEAAVLLRERYLGTVDYGFLDTPANSWKLRLRYTATTGGHLLDDRPGTLPTGRPSPDTPFAATSPTARPSTPSPRRSRTRSVTSCPSTASEPTNR